MSEKQDFGWRGVVFHIKCEQCGNTGILRPGRRGTLRLRDMLNQALPPEVRLPQEATPGTDKPHRDIILRYVSETEFQDSPSSAKEIEIDNLRNDSDHIEADIAELENDLEKIRTSVRE